jgi:hypothetical protein
MILWRDEHRTIPNDDEDVGPQSERSIFCLIKTNDYLLCSPFGRAWGKPITCKNYLSALQLDRCKKTNWFIYSD